MRKIALLDDNNIVINFILAEDSYTPPEKHIIVSDEQGCGVGFKYYEGKGFAAPQPYPSWLFDTEVLFWYAPVPKPRDGNNYIWNEEAQTWDMEIL